MSSVLNHVGIIIPVAPGETAQENLLNDLKHLDNEITISAEGTRAKSLNTGAVNNSQTVFWFLHADSRISAENVQHLEQALAKEPDALHYFDLAFKGGGLFSLNAWGANIRSRLFKLPYGDQGFCLSQKLFNQIGGYPEDVPFGEDLLFIRIAKNKQIKIKRIPSKLLTSARKYKQQGWLKLTLMRQWQMIKLLRQKL